MQKDMLQDTYPVYSLSIDKQASAMQSVDDIIQYLKQKIDEHAVARYIATFDHYAHTDDHYAHTESLEDGVIDEQIQAAKNLVFCFGIKLPNASVLSVRPRSIGVCETRDSFVLNFLEEPVQMATDTMTGWIEEVAGLRQAA